MADFLAGLPHSIDVVLRRLGAGRFDAALYLFAATILLWFCLSVPSAIRRSHLGDSLKKHRRG